jgi:transketolase N-terminal domain/subunit
MPLKIKLLLLICQIRAAKGLAISITLVVALALTAAKFPVYVTDGCGEANEGENE